MSDNEEATQLYMDFPVKQILRCGKYRGWITLRDTFYRLNYHIDIDTVCKIIRMNLLL